jgi:peptide/nickel transport system permease protein
MINATTTEEEAELDAALSTEKAAEKKRRRWQHGSHFVRQRFGLVAGLSIVCFFYAMVIFADFLAPYDYRAQTRRELLAPPTPIHFYSEREGWQMRPFIYARRSVAALERRYIEDQAQAYPIAFFTRGYSYRLFGLLTTDRHLFGLQDQAGVGAPRLHLLGTDALGRDRLSRLLVASRFSLTVGPLGTLLASALGILLGCVAGYAGRTADAALMRTADAMMALPTLVLILAARAAFPLELPPSRAALLLVIIFVVVGWAEMARLARGLVMALRKREFVLAAESIGLSQARVLFRHIMPNAARPLIVQVTLMLPAFLLVETSLSFLGVGLQEPEASWGNMLAQAGDITLLGEQPGLLLLPALAIFFFVLGVHLIGNDLKKRK